MYLQSWLVYFWLTLTDLDYLSRSLADRVQQSLLDTLEVDLVQQMLHRLHTLAVHGQVERTAAHVVHTVDVQSHALLVLLQRLADDGHVTHGGCIQVHTLLVRQLKYRQNSAP